MESIGNHKFIVFCGHGPNALGIIRGLHEKGIVPIMIVNKDGPVNYADRSRFVGKKHYVDNSLDAVELLLELYGNEKYTPFVYTTDDYHTELLDKNYDRLVGRFYFFNCGEAFRLTAFLNKDEQCRVAEECGFAVPKREVVKKGELPKDLQYPIITKTISSNEGGWKKDVYVCQSENDLENAYDKIIANTLLLEEYVNKKCEISIHGISINAGEQVYIPYYSEDYRFSKCSFGHYVRFQQLFNEELVNKVRHYLHAIRFSGIFNMDFLLDQDDHLFFLEINMRSGARNYAVTSGGLNMPFLWANATLTGNTPSNLTLKDSYIAVDELADLNAVFSHDISMKQWMDDIRTADVFFWYYKHDNAPIRYYIRHKLMNGVKKVLGKRK